MANITIRNFPDNIKENLRVQAAKSGISLEAYARYILQKASTSDNFMQPSILDLADIYFGAENGIDLELPKRSSSRTEIKFDT